MRRALRVDAGGVIGEVIAAVNEVTDPCSLGQAFGIGLVDMGLLIGIDVESSSEDRVDVTIHLRTTSPGCMYVPYFEEAIHNRMKEMPAVGEVRLEWEPSLDWNDREMAPAVRERLAERRKQVRERVQAAAV